MLKERTLAKAVEMFPGVVRRTLNFGERTLLTELVFDKDSVVPWHSHPHEQIGYLSSGSLLFELGDDEQKVLHAGDSWLVPSNVRHKVTALEPTIAIDIFSPVREEYKD